MKRAPRACPARGARESAGLTQREAGTALSLGERTGGERAMLELREGCERCGCALAAESRAVRICAQECTYCASCAEVLGGLCPNCGGELVRRPVPRLVWPGPVTPWRSITSR